MKQQMTDERLMEIRNTHELAHWAQCKQMIGELLTELARHRAVLQEADLAEKSAKSNGVKLPEK